jgi:hypothetical protein
MCLLSVEMDSWLFWGPLAAKLSLMTSSVVSKISTSFRDLPSSSYWSLSTPRLWLTPEHFLKQATLSPLFKHLQI